MGLQQLRLLSITTPQVRRLITLSAVALVSLASIVAHAQEPPRGRKYVPPPQTARITVAVVKDFNGKPIPNAAVIFHMVGEEGKGNMELKTNGEGKAAIDVVPIGDTMTLQVIADGFQTFGEDYKITTDSKDIVVRLKRPQKQYSTYEHANGSSGSSSSSNNQNRSNQSGNQKPDNTPPAPQ